MEPLPHEKIQKYIHFSKELLSDCSNNLFIGIADGGNHFLEDGIKEGATLVFDREKVHESGFLSCFMDSERNLHLLKQDIDGYTHLGRLVGVLNAI